MQTIIIIIAVLTILYFIGKHSEPNVENFNLNQMRRHVNNLQRWIDANSYKKNMSENEKVLLAKKKAQLDHALAVWKRKDEEAIARNNELNNLASITKELEPITDRINELKNEGMSEAEASALALKEWGKSNKIE